MRVTAGLLGFSAALALTATTTASAGGFASARFGGEHGNPTTSNATAIYYNPAGLALGSGTRLFVEGLVVYRDATYNRPEGAIRNIAGDGESGTPTDATSANAGEASVTNILVSPFLGVASDLGVDNLGVGLALYAPFGGQAKWDQNEAYKDSTAFPGAVDGVQRWATTEGQIREVYLSTAVAYRLPGPKLSFGLTASLVMESLNTTRARTAIGNDDLTAASGDLIEGRSQVNVKGTTFAAGLGVMWEATDNLRIGVSYQSQPGFGETTMKGELRAKFGNSASTVNNIDFTQELPDVTRLGVSFKPKPNLELRFAADYTRWSVFKKQCLIGSDVEDGNCAIDSNGGATPETKGVIVNILRNWQDTYGVRAGGSYWLNEKTEIAGGLTFDSNAVPDKTIDPAIFDMNKVVATLGGRFGLGDSVLLNISYTHVFYFTRTVAPRARDAMGAPIGLPAPSATPDMAGTYKQMIGLLNLGVEYQF